MSIDECLENEKRGPEDAEMIDAIGMMKGVLSACGSQMGYHGG
jgi:hypothetical protein